MTLKEYLDRFERDINEYIHHVTEFDNGSISAEEFMEKEINFMMLWKSLKNDLVSKYGEE